MCGRAYDPRFLFTWPSAKSAVMGPAQLAGVLSIVARAAAEARGQAVRRGGRRRRCAPSSSRDRGAEPAVLPPRDALRRRHHRPARHPHGARHLPLGHRQRPDPRAPTATGCSARDRCEQRDLKRLLVANRAEIARRVFRTCRRLGIATVAVHSDADAGRRSCARPTWPCDLPGSSARRHLPARRPDRRRRPAIGCRRDPPRLRLPLRERRLRPRCDRRRADLGRAAPESIEAMGSKIEAKRLMRGGRRPGARGCPTSRPTPTCPLLVKASAGGGGRGMRVVRRLADLPGEVAAAEAEALSAFGDGTVFLEPYVERGRHVEVQVLADRDGVVVLGERDCSIQRRHQKIIEESPAPGLPTRPAPPCTTRGRRPRGRSTTSAPGRSSSWSTPGPRRFWFLEMNTRLQVEHPVTELVCGLDLVALQLPVAEAGLGPRRGRAPSADDRAATRSRSGSTPRTRPPTTGRSPGCCTASRSQHGEGDSGSDAGLESGSGVSTFYDAMLAKVVCHAPSREAAARKLADALARARIHGVTTNRDLLVRVLRSDRFLSGQVTPASSDSPSGRRGRAGARPRPPATASPPRRAGRAGAAPHAPSSRDPGRLAQRRRQPQRTEFEDGTAVEWSARPGRLRRRRAHRCRREPDDA